MSELTENDHSGIVLCDSIIEFKQNQSDLNPNFGNILYLDDHSSSERSLYADCN